MKPALIAAVMLAATINFAPRSEAQQRPGSVEEHTQAETQFDGQWLASFDYGKRSTTKAESGEDQPPRWYKSPEWLLVIVGIVTCLFIGWQSWATSRSAKATQEATEGIQRQADIMERQTEATEKAAKAALLNAQAVINSERPWMLLDIERVGPRRFSFKFTNHGRTPAEVVGLYFRLHRRQSTEDLSSPPRYKDEHTVMESTRMVAPGKTFSSPETTVDVAASFDHDSLAEIVQNQGRAICWGRLRYRDLIERPTTIHAAGREIGTLHATCFCYFWSPQLDDFLITGPPGYNEHT